ncbi:hypothetical protein [Pseudaminobacter soli (ex Li et al. 2025)]|uniref:Lipoprotein n=1 Tax=Pseudaminobacter soli (ex Li et al. 2025) TaxID=1295366 RepID=A0A2P7SA06_9HYPH|nr:hypothetical protein [Mesorhizobium soli]PSJ59326.1 hypothetical protein C7I85_17100 [Mesorhizobium soli]
MMVDRVSPVLAALACCGLLAASGCTRTPDGSIEFSPTYVPGTPHWFKRQSATVVVTPAAFPEQPPAPAPIPAPYKAAAKPHKPTKKAAPAAKPATQAAPNPTPDPASMDCHNVTEAGGRVRYVCK